MDVSSSFIDVMMAQFLYFSFSRAYFMVSSVPMSSDRELRNMYGPLLPICLLLPADINITFAAFASHTGPNVDQPVGAAIIAMTCSFISCWTATWVNRESLLLST